LSLMYTTRTIIGYIATYWVTMHLAANYILYESTHPLSGKAGQPSGLLEYIEGTHTKQPCP